MSFLSGQRGTPLVVEALSTRSLTKEKPTRNIEHKWFRATETELGEMPVAAAACGVP